jgi:hypothetical protein
MPGMTKAVLVTCLAVLVAGCGLTAPDTSDLNTYVTFPTFVSASGAPTILDARLLLDDIVEAEDNEPIGFDQALLPPKDSTIAAGRHTLKFLLASQTTSAPTTYTVPKFDITLLACPGGVLADTTQLAETLHLPTQSASLVAGQSITYTFVTPDCTLP